jgi:mannose-6-phosphate isomerase-like protein (cupin superfamily)
VKAEGLDSSVRGIWFLNTLVHVRIAASEGNDGLTVLEHSAPFGDSPPLHVHHTEDEIFHILEGEFRVQVANDTRRCGPEAFLLGPKGVPHTYRVESSAGGRFVTVTAHGDFERFVRAVGRQAERDELPAPVGPPPPEALQQLGAIARTFGIELVGPPLP